MGLHDLPLFLAASLLLNLSPGPDTLFITQRTLSGGWRVGVAACWGIGAGLTVHAAAAAAGVSALVAASAPAFALVRWAGAAYLVLLGVQMWRHAGRQPSAEGAAQAAACRPESPGRVLVQGCLTNVLNPKIVLFFLSFVPQFVDPAAPARHQGYLVLGLIFVLSSMLWLHTLVLLLHLARGRWRLPARWAIWRDRGLGLLLMGFGLRLLSGPRS